jgi:mannose-1-phosphate guanylyltransferase/mannose-6-phosphate isomerase
MKAIVLAGGGGTRLWPLSRADFPKQFLNFGSSLSLLQRTIKRLMEASFIEEIIVSTNAHHLLLIEKQLQKIAPTPKVKILVEPMRKNTGPAIALATKYLQTFCNAKPSDSILVLPSDHLIEPELVFLQALECTEKMSKEPWIITFGIRPCRAETGFGYIQIGERNNSATFKVEKFIEKPNLTAAQKYFEDPNFYWNSGMFLFSISTFWKQLEEHAPEMFQLMLGDYESAKSNFPQMPNLSIDYAVMEKSKQILVCPLTIQWSDVGSWDSVYEVMDKDQNQNVKVGQILDIDTKNSLIIGGKRLISTIGLEDMLIVETEDALFVGKKGQSQQVKTLVEALIQKGCKESTVHPIQTYPWGIVRILEETPLYTIKKIDLNARQKTCLIGEITPLEGTFTQEDGYIYNDSNHPIEVLLIERKSLL